MNKLEMLLQQQIAAVLSKISEDEGSDPDENDEE